MPRLHVEMTRFSRDIDCQYFYEMAIALLDYQLSPTKNSPTITENLLIAASVRLAWTAHGYHPAGRLTIPEGCPMGALPLDRAVRMTA